MVHKIIFTLILFAVIFTKNIFSQQYSTSSTEPKYFLEVQMGYTHYFGVSLAGTIADFTYDLPLAIKFGMSYNIRDAGDPWAARKIFINNNTNGDPQKSGHSFDLRLDFAYPVNWFPVRRTYL